MCVHVLLLLLLQSISGELEALHILSYVGLTVFAACDNRW